MRTYRQKARVNSGSPQLEPMDIPSDSSGDVDDFIVVKSATGEAALSPHPVSMVLPSSSSSEGTVGTMVEFLEVDRPMVGSTNVRVGAPYVTPIRASRRRRAIITAESDEEEDSLERQPRGEMEAKEEELDPLWAEVETSFFIAERGDDADELAEGFNRNKTPRNAGLSRGRAQQ